MESIEYEKMAEVEDAMWYYRALHANLIWPLEKYLPAGDRAVLDAGCGTGGFIRRLAQRHPSFVVTGMDLEPLAIELARGRGGMARFRTGSVTDLPFADASFDAVVSADVLCQIENPAAALAEFHRCLRPGGLVVINMPAYPWLYSYHGTAVGNLRRYSRRELIGLLSAAGFSIPASTYWNSLPFPLAVMQRKLFRSAAGHSDVRLYPAPVEAILAGMMSLERLWLRIGLRLPFGCAVLAVGQKPN